MTLYRYLCAICLGINALTALSGCSDGSDASPPAQDAAAELVEELSGGNGTFIGAALPANLGAVGYVEQEYVAAGTATSYTAIGEPGSS